MRPDHHAQVVALEKRIDVIRSKVHDVVLLLRVSREVVLKSIFLFSLMRVTPEQVEYSLVIFALICTQFNFDRSLNLLNSFNVLNSWSNSSVTAEDTLLFI